MHLSREAEADLVRRWQRHGDAKARETLMHAFWPAIAKFASRYRAPGLEPQDLTQIAAIGFMVGIDKWEESHGLRLYTYAVWQMKSALNKACKTASKTGALEVVLLLKSHEEDAREVSVDYFADTRPIPEDVALDNERGRMLREAIATLTSREQTIINSRWMGGGRTLESISRELGVTRERVRQIEADALRKIRRLLKDCA